MVSTTSTGNLAFTKSEDVAFDMAGTVKDVLVSVGDTVKKDQLLATLDTSAWSDQIETTSESVTTAQRNLVTAERQIGAQQLSVTQAQLNLQGAQNSATSIAVVQNAQDLVDNAQAALQNAQVQYMVDPTTYGPAVANIRVQLGQAQKNLQSVLSGTSFNVSTDVALQILKSQLAVQQAQRAVDDANIAVTNATQARDDAAQTLSDAQTTLSETQALSPEVRAPFDGRPIGAVARDRGGSNPVPGDCPSWGAQYRHDVNRWRRHRAGQFNYWSDASGHNYGYRPHSNRAVGGSKLSDNGRNPVRCLRLETVIRQLHRKYTRGPRRKVAPSGWGGEFLSRDHPAGSEW